MALDVRLITQFYYLEHKKKNHMQEYGTQIENLIYGTNILPVKQIINHRLVCIFYIDDTYIKPYTVS